MGSTSALFVMPIFDIGVLGDMMDLADKYLLIFEEVSAIFTQKRQ